MTVFRDPAHPQRKAVEECPPGAVLVIDSRKDAARPRPARSWSTRLMVRGCRRHGDGWRLPRLARRSPRSDMPAYHTRPSAPTNLTLHQAIDINVPIGCGDAPVFPGDVVVGDMDGVIVIPAGDRRRDRRRGGGDDGLRGFRHRAGGGGPQDDRPVSADGREQPRRNSPSGASSTADRTRIDRCQKDRTCSSRRSRTRASSASSASPARRTSTSSRSLRRSSIKLIITRHEQAAAFMAATYGRLTGKPGVCIATLGPARST